MCIMVASAFNWEIYYLFHDIKFILQLFNRKWFYLCVERETPEVVEPASERGKQEDVTTSSQKKHKKHKKHKSKKKKKKRNRDREKEISSGCERGAQHRLR